MNIKLISSVLFQNGFYGMDIVEYDRIVAVPGDLSKPQLGLTASQFDSLAGAIGVYFSLQSIEAIDVIYHCGAEVNWIKTYSALRHSNVLGTIEIGKLAVQFKPKPIHYISTIGVAEKSEESSQEEYAKNGILSGYR